MWLVDPELMCRNHLLGEHLELHILASCLNEGKGIAGFIEYGLVDPSLLFNRHELLVKEMKKRGYRHYSPIGKLPDRLDRGHVDPGDNIEALAARCDQCRRRIESGKGSEN